MPSPEATALAAPEKSTVQDKLWLWAHDAGAHNESWGLPRPSRITPTEAAVYLGISNLIMVRYLGKPALPFDQYALPFRALKRVVWSVVGATGQTDESERSYVLDLANRNPNITGLMLDDFFGTDEAGQADEPALPLEKLRELHGALKAAARQLGLWAVVYDHQLDRPLTQYLPYVDVLTFWTWDSAKLQELQSNLEQLERLAPRNSLVLGCYFWDYARKKPMPLDLLQEQCELGLRWLRQGRIEGIIFLASCICDLELEAVEWTRNWIAEMGPRQV